ncbi:Imm51 family immunity protein [Rufibacter psychrotolerans]|uniref:Imm51 family immunity protein n=1 Tax=Rufibacter psychrotolerans TaxID=2812556 RepID=UPI001967AE02|nr:Imm51 family immunity protein [Rufibacter sp. SYSU D00308]
MKHLYIFILLLLMSCSKGSQTPKNEKLVLALNNPDLAIRGTLVEISPNEYRLDYYDVHEKDSHLAFLSKKGYQGGGPTWLGIIYGAIQLSDPAIEAKIRFDDEAEGLAIWSSDKESLEKIGRLISVVKSDESVMAQAIQVAEQAGEME